MSEPGSGIPGSGDPGGSSFAPRVSSGAKKGGAADDPGDGWTTVTRKARPLHQGDPVKPSPAGLQQDGSKNLGGFHGGSRPQTLPIRRIQRKSSISTQPSSGAIPTNWKNICFASSSSPDENRKLEFVPPKIIQGRKVAVLDNLDTQQAEERWKNTITGYIMGKRPYYPHLKANVSRQWKIKGSIDIYTRDNGFFLFKMSQTEDYLHILEDGPWFFNGRLMILKPWNASSGLDRELLNSIPTWIKLPGLNLQAWSQSSIAKIASIIGTPLLLDKMTANGSRMEFARCLVEIEAASEQPQSVTVVLEDGYTYEQPIIYEWLPKKCSNCISFDHSSLECISPVRPEIQGSLLHQSSTEEVPGQKLTSPDNFATLISDVMDCTSQGKTELRADTVNTSDSMMVCSPDVCKNAPQSASQSKLPDLMEVISSYKKIKASAQVTQITKVQTLSQVPYSPRPEKGSPVLSTTDPLKPSSSFKVDSQYQPSVETESSPLTPNPEMDMEVQFQGTNSPGESILDCPPPVCVIVPLPGSTSNNTNVVQSLSQITPTSPRVITRGMAVQASNIPGKMDCSSPDLMDPGFPLTIANPDWVAPKFRGPHRQKPPKSLDSLKCLKNLPSSLKRQSRGKAKKEQCISCDTLLSSISNK